MENRLGMRRMIAESISLGRFVAPRTRMRVSLPVASPSHSLRRLVLAFDIAPPKAQTHVMNSAFLCEV